MNFMSGRSGFYEERSGAGAGAGNNNRGISYSSSTSPSSTFHQRGHHPYPYPIVGGGGEEMDPTDDEHVLRRLGGEGSSSAADIPREHMFDKVVTPSDVGKLNRLVIPKQHAEKYFPLDSTANEKGLLLNFEDRNGKPWRFRYSYWNSSQSYVMTKGWSRFVKEKRLDAGDIVSFQRGVGEIGKDRLFIDWRRRPDAPDIQTHLPSFAAVQNQYHHHNRSVHPWSPLFINPPPRDYLQFLQSNNPSSAAASVAHHNHPYHLPAGYGPYGVVNGNPCLPGSIMYLRSGGGGGGGGIPGPHRGGGGGGSSEQMVFESVPVVHGKAAAKRLRLFGVNMDCPISDSEEEGDIIMSPSTVTLPLLHHLPPSPSRPYFDSSPSSSSIPSDLQLRPCYSNNKDKGSMSLDLDI